ncbi:hypothetical protein [Roseomonas sp. USHLN139]|uniref:hypothetical protein n=1 Tax=Roseomonas sp. USHLN139 TaxID=3081298 RepID=UPI003B0261FC
MANLIYRSLLRRRIVVVEDSFFLASHIADVLEEVGASILGPVPAFEQALKVAQSMDLDAAVFNSVLRGLRSDQLAESLGRRGVLCLVLSLTDKDDTDPLLRNHAVFQWPFDPRILVDMVVALVSRSTSSVDRQPPNPAHFQ